MAVPKRKISKSKGGMRRANKGLSKIKLVLDSETGEWKLPHQATPSGFYKGKYFTKQSSDVVEGEAE